MPLISGLNASEKNCNAQKKHAKRLEFFRQRYKFRPKKANKKGRTAAVSLYPHKDNTFYSEMQIVLTFLNIQKKRCFRRNALPKVVLLSLCVLVTLAVAFPLVTQMAQRLEDVVNTDDDAEGAFADGVCRFSQAPYGEDEER